MEKRRSALTVILSAMLVVGGGTVAGPASANPWSGQLSCPISARATARGTNGASGSTRVTVGAEYIQTNLSNTQITLRHPTATSGSWRVSGTGATSGIGFCS